MFSLSMLNWHIMFWGSLSGFVITLIMSKRIKIARVFAYAKLIVYQNKCFAK